VLPHTGAHAPPSRAEHQFPVPGDEPAENPVAKVSDPSARRDRQPQSHDIEQRAQRPEFRISLLGQRPIERRRVEPRSLRDGRYAAEGLRQASEREQEFVLVSVRKHFIEISSREGTVATKALDGRLVVRHG
jgi:hypothetical protein